MRPTVDTNMYDEDIMLQGCVAHSSSFPSSLPKTTAYPKLRERLVKIKEQIHISSMNKPKKRRAVILQLTLSNTAFRDIKTHEVAHPRHVRELEAIMDHFERCNREEQIKALGAASNFARAKWTHEILSNRKNLQRCIKLMQTSRGCKLVGTLLTRLTSRPSGMLTFLRFVCKPLQDHLLYDTAGMTIPPILPGAKVGLSGA